MQFYTTTRISDHQELTPEGFLLIRDVRIARCGRQFYRDNELPEVEAGADGWISVDREPGEVFRDESIRSFTGKPITNDHPTDIVTPDNWSDLAIGVVQTARRGHGADHDCLVADLLFTTKRGIGAIRKGKRSLSVGYDAYYEQDEPGQARQRNIVANHLALVDEGRCGKRCTIVDGAPSYDVDFVAADHPRKGKGEGGGQFTASGGGGGVQSFTKAKPPQPGATLNGVKFEKWDVVPHTDQAWENVAKLDAKTKPFEEPPLPQTGKKQAAGVIIREPDGRVWIVHPTNAYGGYKATFPKGGVDPGMSHRATAIKEAYEESGLRVRLTGFAGDVERSTSTARYYYAERLHGSPDDHGWETEKVTLAPVEELKKHLNMAVDHKMVDDFLGKQDLPKPGSAAQQEMHEAATEENWQHATKIKQLKSDIAHAEDPADKAYGQQLLAALGHKEEPESDPGAPLDVSKMKQVGGQLGSNPGGQYEHPNGQKYYVKASKSDDHARNELLAARLYEAAGAPVLPAQAVNMGGKLGTATPWQDVKLIDKDNAAHRAEAQQHFATHAWLANWDAAGLGFDNQGVVDGKMATLDPGGSLLYRAQGAPKGAAFGDTVGEWDSLRAPSNPQAHKLFGEMNGAGLRDSALRVARVPDQTIHALTHAHGPGTAEQKAALAKRLVARKRDLVKRALGHTKDAVGWAEDVDYDRHEDLAA